MKKLINKLNNNFIFLIILFVCINTAAAQENKNDPAFKLPEETIMGKEKEKNESEGKQDVRIEEKYELEKSSAEKITPDILLKERAQKEIEAKSKRNIQTDLDISAGNYNALNFHINHKQDHKIMSFSIEFDKKFGNRSRPDSIYEYYTFGGQLFSNRIDFAFIINSNNFDLPGRINNRISDLSRKCDNYRFSFDVKIIEHLFIIIDGENTNIKEKTSLKDQTFGLKILYDFKKNKSPYAFTAEVEENKLAGHYNYAFYSFEMENQAISLNEKSQAKISAGLSREGGEKIYLNPKLSVFHKYDNLTDMEAGVKRQNKKIGFYDLYGKNNFAELNLLPLKRINYCQMYSKVFKRLRNNNSIGAKIFHDWISDYVVFDEDENNADGFWKPLNLGNVQRDGIQISYRQKYLQRISGKIDYKYFDAWNENKTKTVPRQSNIMNAVIKYNGPSYQLSVNGKYTGQGYYDKDKNEKLGGYLLLGILAEKPVSDNLMIYARANNILNKRYEIIKNYPGDRAKIITGCKFIF